MERGDVSHGGGGGVYFVTVVRETNDASAALLSLHSAQRSAVSGQFVCGHPLAPRWQHS